VRELPFCFVGASMTAARTRKLRVARRVWIWNQLVRQSKCGRMTVVRLSGDCHTCAVWMWYESRRVRVSYMLVVVVSYVLPCLYWYKQASKIKRQWRYKQQRYGYSFLRQFRWSEVLEDWGRSVWLHATCFWWSRSVGRPCAYVVHYDCYCSANSNKQTRRSSISHISVTSTISLIKMLISPSVTQQLCEVTP